MRISGGLGLLECREVAKHMYGEEKLARRILYENTLFGVLSRGMSSDAQKRVSNEYIVQNAVASNGSLLKSCWIRLRSLALKDLRSCVQCVVSDIDERGFSSWRVLHQLDQVDCCVYHGCRLTVEVVAPGGSNKRLTFADLPTGKEIDVVSSQKAPIPSTNGYCRYLKSWGQAFNDELPQIAIDQWMSQLEEAKAIVGGKKELAALIRDNLEKEWDCSLLEISSSLRFDGGEDFLAQELAFNTHPGCVARRLVVQGALEQLSLNSVDLETRPQHSLHFPSRATHSRPGCRESAEQRLRRAIFDSGNYPSIWSAMKTRISQAEVVRTSGASKQSVSWIIRALPDDLLSELNANGDWPSESWLTKAIERRNSVSTPSSRSEENHRQTEISLLYRQTRKTDVTEQE